eukprot:scaffold8647_cov183-Amphora_coffeaeformis.AAC.1
MQSEYTSHEWEEPKPETKHDCLSRDMIDPPELQLRKAFVPKIANGIRDNKHPCRLLQSIEFYHTHCQVALPDNGHTSSNTRTIRCSISDNTSGRLRC